MTRGAAIKQKELLATEEDQKNSLQHFGLPGRSCPARADSVAKDAVVDQSSPEKQVSSVKGESQSATSLMTLISAGESAPRRLKNPRRKKSDAANTAFIVEGATNEALLPTSREKKRKRFKPDDYLELPHNMGKVHWSSGPKRSNGETAAPIPVRKERNTRTRTVKGKKIEDKDDALERASKAKIATATKKPTPAQETKRAKGAQDAKTRLAALKAKLAKDAAGATKPAADSSPKKKPKQAKKDPYGLTEGKTPFPHWSRPTAEECQQVHDILLHHHKNVVTLQPTTTIPPPSAQVAGCGEVRSVLDALLRTKLSASTTFEHADAAYRGMVARYGVVESGVGKGSCDYDAVRLAPVEDLYRAIGGGGLGAVKSAEIMAILDMVFEENRERRRQESSLLLPAATAAVGAAGNEEAQIGSDVIAAAAAAADTASADDGNEGSEDENLSLDHCYHLPTADATRKFRSYPGIGVKTAACVALFCLQRPCFAVDTHVFRLCRWLGWVPPPPTPSSSSSSGKRKREDKGRGAETRAVNRDSAFSHLEVRVPDRLKYMLHQLFIAHRKTCGKCGGREGGKGGGESEECVIEHLVTRTRVRRREVGSGKEGKEGGSIGRRRKVQSKSDGRDEVE